MMGKYLLRWRSVCCQRQACLQSHLVDGHQLFGCGLDLFVERRESDLLGVLAHVPRGSAADDDRGGRDRCEPTLGRDLVTVPLMQRLGHDATR
jgi:hypothetical protein